MQSQKNVARASMMGCRATRWRGGHPRKRNTGAQLEPTEPKSARRARSHKFSVPSIVYRNRESVRYSKRSDFCESYSKRSDFCEFCASYDCRATLQSVCTSTHE